MSALYMSREFAKRLKAARVAGGFTQDEIAKKLGYTTAQFISNWERGVAFPPLDALAKLIRIYRLDANTVVEMCLEAASERLHKAMKIKGAR